RHQVARTVRHHGGDGAGDVGDRGEGARVGHQAAAGHVGDRLGRGPGAVGAMADPVDLEVGAVVGDLHRHQGPHRGDGGDGARPLALAGELDGVGLEAVAQGAAREPLDDRVSVGTEDVFHCYLYNTNYEI